VKTYWQWFFSRKNGGLIRFADRWLLVHLFVGLVTYLSVPLPLSEAAKAVLLPLVSALVGLTFAWAGNAQALLRSVEIEDLSRFVPGGFTTYAYAFQTAILAVLVTVSLWGLAGLALFDRIDGSVQRAAVGVALYAISSLAVRECWHVVLGAQSLLLAAQRVRESKTDANNKNDGPPLSHKR
jgi:hypothetical protein